HRPGSNNCVASACYSFQETSPTCRTYAFLLHFALLEGIINRCWIRFRGLACKAGDSFHHALQEKCFGLRLAAVPIGCSYQLLGLWHGHHCRNLGVNRSYCPAKPYIKEIRKICVSNIVVIWRVC